MNNLTAKVDEKCLAKREQGETFYVDMFERNVMKRKKMEDKKAKLAEDNAATFEFNMIQKEEKLMAIQGRQNKNKDDLERRNKLLEKRWKGIKNRAMNMT